MKKAGLVPAFFCARERRRIARLPAAFILLPP